MKALYLLLVLLLALPIAPFIVVPSVTASELTPPVLLLARHYQPGIPLENYWVSEKLDGVRAYWDGRRLRSRSGMRIRAPGWFTKVLPDTPLDGELWIGPGRFDQLSGTVRKREPVDAEWRQVRLMLFDLPADEGAFDTRLAKLNRLVADLDQPWVRAVGQARVEDETALMARLQAVVASRGEGLMLHRGDSRYRGERSRDLLKLKTYRDAEAAVIAQYPGKGKYQGMMGSLLVRTDEGLEFRLGSGFSDRQRRDPPAPGTRITYRYNGETAGGKPRFARFLRIRDAL